MSATGTVDTRHIANLAVDTAELVGAAVTNAKLGPDAVDGAKIADDAVDSEHLAAGGIDGEHLSTDAKQETLQSKFVSGFVQTTIAGAGGTEDTVTTEVEAASVDDTERNTPTGLGILSTGTTPNDTAGTATQNYKVQIKTTSTGEPVDDGAGGEVYGVLSENAGAWTLTYYKGDGTAHTLATASIDILFANVFDLDSLPANAFLLGPTFGDIAGVGAAHNHTLAEVTDVTVTAAELNQALDGISANVTDTNLNTLTGAGDAGALHNHDGQYFTESELGNQTDALAGAKLIGIDASAIGPNAGAVDTVYGVLDALEAAIAALPNALTQERDTLTGEAQAGDAVLTFALSATPADVTKVIAFMGMIYLEYGVHYTISGTAITWLGATSGLALLAGDRVNWHYFS